ncbi:MAG: RlmE family RNA methyltransferase [Methylophilales bacterium]|nr:RlmE family RNA methyltransferase [Pseudomonadota bacterium]NQW34722.1 RlmE family RNA methyltransferase [Methylophilales bacterium]
MKRSKTSKSWMNEHVSDIFVRQAQSDGYRSRAAYKLIEANEKFKLLEKGMVVVDLGAAPGSWCQVINNAIGSQGKIFALDLLEMHPIKNVDFIQGDFRDELVLHELENKLNDLKVDLVISDMAPNISGIKTKDQAGIIHLNELALDFAINWMKPNGNFLVKSFIGEQYESFIEAARVVFTRVTTFKPKSSRDRSAEIFIVGQKIKNIEQLNDFGLE